ncbi:MAG: VanZ family protein [Butyrivibrio sp.]|nr:VanZ family protein [Butyrivibrio sp.]
MDDNSNLQVLAQIFAKETEGIRLENMLILFILAAAAVCFGGWIAGRKREVKCKRMIHMYLFLVYMGFLFTITIFRRPIGSREGIVHLFINLGFGLRSGRPSLKISAYSIFNILLFVPFGVLASIAIRNKSRARGILVSTAIGFALSLTIECIQLATGRGMFETTDLLTNTAGSLIGALITVALNALFRSKHGDIHESING